MARGSGHDGDGVSGAPETIQLSGDELADLTAELTGGFSVVTEVAPTTPLPTANPVQDVSASSLTQGTTTSGLGHTLIRPAFVSSPAPGDSGSFGAPATGVPATGSFGTPTTGVPTTSMGGNVPSTTTSGGTFGTPAGLGGSMATSGGNEMRSSRRPFGEVIRSRLDNLPELWGLDLVLGIASIIGVVLIVTNLDAVLLSIANLVYRLLSGTLQVGMFLLVIVVAAFFLFGRRRRW